MIPFGPWEPDRAPRLNDEILRVADGVFPTPDGWRPCGQWAVYTGPLSSTARGGASFTSPAGSNVIIAGTPTTLEIVEGGEWGELSDGYTLSGNDRWRFAQFGGLAIATNGTDPMQKIDLATHDVDDLGGTPPTFKMLAVVKDFLVGGVMGGDVMKMGWSGINDAEWWTPAQKQCDYQVMPAGGAINGILSGEFGIILQRSRICRMDYVGGNVIFDINEISDNIGCVSIHSVAQWGRLGFWWSDEGPIMWNGSEISQIGDEKVNRYLTARYTNEAWTTMSAAIDPVLSVVMWAMPDQIVGYNWRLQRFFTLPCRARIVFAGVTRDIDLDEQDIAVGEADDNLDAPGLKPLDSQTFIGGSPRLYVFSQDNAIGTFDGSPMAATLTGGDVELFKGRRARLRFVRPECDAVGGVRLTLSTRQRLGDAMDASGFSALMPSGEMPVRTNGRYTRATLQISVGTPWTFAEGLEFIGEPGGAR